MAATIPSCRSLASMWRVPNRMVKAARDSATYSAVSCRTGVVADSGATVTAPLCSMAAFTEKRPPAWVDHT